MDEYVTYDDSSLRAIESPLVPENIESVTYKRKERRFISDTNYGNYASGEIVFDLKTIADDLILYRDAYVRGTVYVKSSLHATTPYLVGDGIAMRCGVQGLFDRITVEVNNQSVVNTSGAAIANRTIELLHHIPIDADDCNLHWSPDMPLPGSLPLRKLTEAVTSLSDYASAAPDLTLTGTATATADGLLFADIFSGQDAITSPYGIISFKGTFPHTAATTTGTLLLAQMKFTPFDVRSRLNLGARVGANLGALLGATPSGADIAALFALVGVVPGTGSEYEGWAQRATWFRDNSQFNAGVHAVQVQIPLRKVCDLFEKLVQPVANVYFRIRLGLASNANSSPFQVVRGLSKPDLDPSIVLGTVANGWRLYYDRVYLRPEAGKMRAKMLGGKASHFIGYRDNIVVSKYVADPGAASQTLEVITSIKGARYMYVVAQARVHPSPTGAGAGDAVSRFPALSEPLSSGLQSDVQLTNYNVLIDNKELYASSVQTDEDAYQYYREMTPFGWGLEKVGVLSFSEWRRKYRILCFDLARNNAAYDPAKAVQIQFKYELPSTNTGTDVYSDIDVTSRLNFDLYFIINYDASVTINEETQSVVSINQ